MTRALFICSRNRLRSPTAERVFSSYPGVEVASAGLNRDADVAVTPDLLEWADVIFVMESSHRTRLQRRFGRWLRGRRLICLDVPDRYDYMDPELVKRLENSVPPFL